MVVKKKVTPIKLTRFEKARLIGARALQLSLGATPLVDISASIDPVDIATLELKENVIPLKVGVLD
ncbi:MAG: DNA-directed RNA polymerase subunit K [Methanobacterium sp.]|jgi:DNA-directed RNA polymerase subunit K